jgi:hypothetical protein
MLNYLLATSAQLIENSYSDRSLECLELLFKMEIDMVVVAMISLNGLNHGGWGPITTKKQAASYRRANNYLES